MIVYLLHNVWLMSTLKMGKTLTSLRNEEADKERLSDDTEIP